MYRWTAAPSTSAEPSLRRVAVRLWQPSRRSFVRSFPRRGWSAELSQCRGGPVSGSRCLMCWLHTRSQSVDRRAGMNICRGSLGSQLFCRFLILPRFPVVTAASLALQSPIRLICRNAFTSEPYKAVVNSYVRVNRPVQKCTICCCSFIAGSPRSGLSSCCDGGLH